MEYLPSKMHAAGGGDEAISQAVSTIKPTDIPTHLLRTAYMIGKVPVRACRSDPRISYTLYVPEQYCAVHDALRQPDIKEAPERLTLLVNIHSTRRDMIGCRDTLSKFADKHGVAILAPLFPAGLDSPLDLESYRLLRSKTLQSDLRLLDILNEISHLWPGINTDPIVMMGFSGGAQFCHRFLYLYPERVSAMIVASPGKTTKLDNKGSWPKGTANIEEVFPGQELNLDAIRAVEHLLLMVGGDDEYNDETVELQRWLAERASKISGKKASEMPDDKTLQQSRVNGIKMLHQNWQEHGIKCELEIVPGVAHSYVGLVGSMIAWLEKCPAILQNARQL